MYRRRSLVRRRGRHGPAPNQVSSQKIGVILKRHLAQVQQPSCTREMRMMGRISHRYSFSAAMIPTTSEMIKYTESNGNGSFQKSVLDHSIECLRVVLTLPASFFPSTCPDRTKIGSTCQMSNALCDLTRPCQNSGVCRHTNSTGPVGYFCSCLSDFEGSQCQFDRRVCREGTCWNEGIVHFIFS